MIAVIQTGGKQYTVKEGTKIRVEKLPAKEGENVEFNEVLLTAADDGHDVKVGTPFVQGAKVTAKVLEQGRDKKVTVVKYKNKTRYKRTLGHRQYKTAVEITNIAA